MKNVTMYVKPSCPYCQRAKALLSQYGVTPTLIDIAANPGKRQELLSKVPGARTVPQIFIGDQHVGGCDDLVRIEKSGKLKEMLGV